MTVDLMQKPLSEVSPRPPLELPSTTQEYTYTYDEGVSSPLTSSKNAKGEILQDAVNIRPNKGIKFNCVNLALKSTARPPKFIYTMRHGNARHNAISDTFTKPISWRFTSKLRANFDPGLTAKGVQDAQRSGKILSGLARSEGAPLPVTVYTSPLRRCIQTAMYALAKLRPPGPVTLHIKEGLREWKGYEHNHMSDRRNTTTAILALVAQLSVELGLTVCPVLDWSLDQPDETDMRETYVDVDRRVRKVLDDIFADPTSGRCVMLILHNRSNKSLLRVLGHTQPQVHGLDLENCAVLSYLVSQRLLAPAESLARAHEETSQWELDRELAEREKKERHEQAAAHVRGYCCDHGEAGEEKRKEGRGKLRRLRDYLQQERFKGDIGAAKALVDLYACVPDLDNMTSKKEEDDGKNELGDHQQQQHPAEEEFCSGSDAACPARKS